MSQVPLQIAAPTNGQKFPGSGSVHMTGTVSSADQPGLFFKWYSSLAIDPLGTTLDFTASLKTGSHVVTFTAKDVAGDAAADLQSIQRAGFAGGPPIANPPCIIHIFLANMVLPATDGTVLSKALSTLSAEAPPSWPADAYQAVNHLQFHWSFTPVGLPGGRTGGDLIAAFNQLTFRDVQTSDPAGTPPQVIYTGPLPATLDTGDYTLSLRVEDMTNNSIGHEVARSVVLNS